MIKTGQTILADDINLISFGDGSDGAVTLNGSTTYNTFSSLSNPTYTLTRDLYATNLTINSGIKLYTAGFRVFISGTLSGAGNIHNNGNNGSNGVNGTKGAGGTAVTTGYFQNVAGTDGANGD
jgi:hypothetical protein